MSDTKNLADSLSIPNHLAIIMDGNGRWAEHYSKPRVWGHHKGVRAVRTTIENSRKVGIKYLTLYAFSEENWARPKYEVDSIMNLLFLYLKRERKALKENDISLKVIGDASKLPEKVQSELQDTVEFLATCESMTLVLALSYGGRQEMIRAIRMLAEDVASHKLDPHDLDEGLFETYLWTSSLPDPDLMIRTSGEQRISNFLLWQMAYTEFYFTQKCWPDFDTTEFHRALGAYSHRKRRFGKASDSRRLSPAELSQLQEETGVSC